MSRALEIADQMAEEARTLQALSDSRVVVWRQQDITSEVDRALSQASGAAIVIRDGGCTRPEDTEHVIGPRVVQSYILGLFYAPVVRPGGKTIDNVAEALIRYFDHWVPKESSTERDVWMRFRDRDEGVADELGFHYQELLFDIVIQFTNRP